MSDGRASTWTASADTASLDESRGQPEEEVDGADEDEESPIFLFSPALLAAAPLRLLPLFFPFCRSRHRSVMIFSLRCLGPRTSLLPHNSFRPPRATTRRSAPHAVRRSSPTNCDSCECVRAA